MSWFGHERRSPKNGRHPAATRVNRPRAQRFERPAQVIRTTHGLHSDRAKAAIGNPRFDLPRDPLLAAIWCYHWSRAADSVRRSSWRVCSHYEVKRSCHCNPHSRRSSPPDQKDLPRLNAPSYSGRPNDIFNHLSVVAAGEKLISATTSARVHYHEYDSADSLATSVPAPIAIPTSCGRNAGASLTPSPIIATFLAAA